MTPEGQGADRVLARPVVAIIGRPNVGKSALFNRLAGKRIAIVHHERGITRDRITCEVEWNGRYFELQDTCGISIPVGAHADDQLIDAAHRQVESAVREASVLVMVVDIHGLAPMDFEVAEVARRSGKPVIVAANKADNPQLDSQAAEMEEVGFPVWPVSALHGRGIGPLLDEVVRRLPPAAPAAAGPPSIRVVVAGRPNVGKSSYINALLKEERMVVSPVPGTTRDAVEIPFRVGDAAEGRRYLLVDTAGMRKRGKARTAVEKFSLLRTEASIRRSDVVILMIDAVEGPHRQDKKVGYMINEWGKGGLILVNKWDLASGVSEREYEEGLRRYMPFLSHLPVVFVSAMTGRNIDVSLEALDFVAAQLDARVGTGVLNRVLQAAVEQHRPVFRDGRPFKLYYAAQTGTRPPQFTLFVNRVKGLPGTYEAYLVNYLRRAFGFEGVVVRLRMCPHRPAQKTPG